MPSAEGATVGRGFQRRVVKRPDRFPRHLSRLASLSTRELRLTRATIKPVRSDNGQVRLASLRQSPTGMILQSETIGLVTAIRAATEGSVCPGRRSGLRKMQAQ